TLRRLGEVGAEDFYRGGIAQQIANDMRRHGGLITERDLALCGPPVERAPISTMYRGFQILTVPPPPGGAQLPLALHIRAQLGTLWFPAFAEDWRGPVALTTSAVFRIRDLEPAGAPGPMSLMHHPLLSE